MARTSAFFLFFIPNRSHESATSMANSLCKYIWCGWHIAFVCMHTYVYVCSCSPQSCSLCIFKELCNHHHDLILEKFHHTKKNKKTKPHKKQKQKTAPINRYSPPLLFALGKHQSIFNVCRFDYAGYFIKWNSTIRVHLLLTSFIEHNIFRIHPCCIIL